MGQPNGGQMSEAWLYAGVTAAVAAVMTAAGGDRGQVSGFCCLSDRCLRLGPPLGRCPAALGQTVLLVIPYTYLLVSAALPWKRAWARWAVPGIVVAGCSALAATPSASLLVRVLLAAPFAIGLLALFRGWLVFRPVIGKAADSAIAGDLGTRTPRRLRRFPWLSGRSWRWPRFRGLPASPSSVSGCGSCSSRFDTRPRAPGPASAT